jgi:large subunit ribosomal protein L4
MKAAALRGALSDRARSGRVHVVSSLVDGSLPSTKAAAASLAAISDRPHVLVVVERDDSLTWKSLRNVVNVHLLVPDQLNTSDVLVSDDVVFTEGALAAFLAGPTQGKGATAVATESEAASVPEPVATDEPKADKPKPAAKAAPAETAAEADSDEQPVSAAEEAKAGATKAAAKKAPAKKAPAKKAPAKQAEAGPADAPEAKAEASTETSTETTSDSEGSEA